MSAAARPSRRDLAFVAAFVLAAGLCMWGEPWHIDEPFFLAIARQILRDPLHPLSFAFNWYGVSEPMASLNNAPFLSAYLLAGALKISGGGEFWTRACFFPFDLAAAWSLLALAARFLKRPLWPTLVVLAGPAWALNLPHVMAERVMAGLAFPALWLAVTAFDEGGAWTFWGSAALASLSILSKYNALFLIPPVVVYGRSRGASWKRLALWCAAASSGGAASLLWNWSVGGSGLHAVWGVASASSRLLSSRPSQRLRALLAFTGGLGFFAAAWTGRLRVERLALLVSAAGCAFLFGPWFDLASVRPLDRAAGILFAWAAIVAGWSAVRGSGRGAALWTPWLLGMTVLQLAYWSVVARFVAFLLPPLIYALWERLEAERPAELNRLGCAAFGVALVLTIPLGTVDWAFASGQKIAATAAQAQERPRGGTVWYWGHWGLQEYMSAAGARQLDRSRGGWDAARSGDLVVESAINTNPIPPNRPRLADITTISIGTPIPLRLIGGWKGEAGFYTSSMGFLPWTVSRAPVDEFTLVELR